MRRIAVVSNIPTPYNDALFREVAAQPGVALQLLYGAGREANRSWRLADDKGYAYAVLPGRTVAGSAHVNPGVAAALHRVAPDVALLSGGYAMPTAQLAAAALAFGGTPWAYWGEELAHGARPAPLRAVRAALRWPVRRARGVLAIGSRARRSYERAGVPAERIADFRYYADTRRFALTPAAGERAREQARLTIGLAADAVAVLYVGQLIRRKGVDTLVRALAAGPGLGRTHLLVAGDGPERAALAALAAGLGVASRVHLLGFRQPDALPHLFAAADAFALPSHAEGWGVVVPEAMAAGLPVLASERVNAAADLVVDGETGWRFPAGDAGRLAELLGAVAADGALRTRIGARAREAVRQETPEVAAPRLVRLLDAVRAGARIDGL